MADIENQKKGLASFSALTLTLIGGILASPLAIYYYRHDDSGRGLVSLVAAACLMYVLSAKWGLRSETWFWVTVVIVVAINLSIIVFVPWPNGRAVHGPVLAPFGAVLAGLDYFAIFLAGKLRQRSNTIQ